MKSFKRNVLNNKKPLIFTLMASYFYIQFFTYKSDINLVCIKFLEGGKHGGEFQRNI